MDTTSFLIGKKSGGGSGGSSNYNDLSNKPSINNTTLSGNKSLNDLGIVNGSSKRLLVVENGTINTESNIAVLQEIYDDYNNDNLNFGEVYLKYTSQDYTQEDSYYLLTKVHANSQAMQLQFYDTFVNDQDTTKNTKIVNVGCNVNEGEVDYALINTYDIASSGSGSVDVFYEDATYENPFIFSGKKKGIYFLKYDDERAYAKFNASSSSVVNLATVINNRINGIMCNVIEIYKDVPDNIANGESFATYIGYAYDKNHLEGPFQRVFVSRKTNSNNGLDFFTGDIAAYSNIQTVYNKTTSINSNSTDTQYPSAKAVWDLPTTYSGYDATKTQVLKNVNGTLTWVDE